MRVFLTPQFNENEYITHMFSEEKIKAERYVLDEVSDMGSEHQESNKEYKLSETLYYDLSSIETESTYVGDDVISNAKRDDDGALHVELLNPISEDSPEEFMFPEWQDAEFNHFDIPEGVEVLTLTKVDTPQPETSPIDHIIAENKALEVRLESMKRQLEEDRKRNERTTLELLELMTELL